MKHNRMCNDLCCTEEMTLVITDKESKVTLQFLLGLVIFFSFLWGVMNPGPCASRQPLLSSCTSSPLLSEQKIQTYSHGQAATLLQKVQSAHQDQEFLYFNFFRKSLNGNTTVKVDTSQKQRSLQATLIGISKTCGW